ncbi:hypothetical protein LJC15_00225 [Desulfovibrio sp. OttesenSCG-928-G11]|nr:hypothetical protein [Desulfovibrio sp. OttesenSCG-928-G11]
MITESTEARLARIEEKLDGIFARLSERCGGNVARLNSHEKSINRFGERLGKLEADQHQRKGGKAAVIGLLTGGGVLGGLAVKVAEFLGKGS